MQLLKLVALDQEDLTVLSAHLQDAVSDLCVLIDRLEDELARRPDAAAKTDRHAMPSPEHSRAYIVSVDRPLSGTPGVITSVLPREVLR